LIIFEKPTSQYRLRLFEGLISIPVYEKMPDLAQSRLEAVSDPIGASDSNRDVSARSMSFREMHFNWSLPRFHLYAETKREECCWKVLLQHPFSKPWL
jgi:hypothetical protein